MFSFDLARFDSRIVQRSHEHVTIYVRDLADCRKLLENNSLFSLFKSIKFVFFCSVTLPEFKKVIEHLTFENLEHLDVIGETGVAIMSIESLFKVFPNLKNIKTYKIFGVSGDNRRLASR